MEEALYYFYNTPSSTRIVSLLGILKFDVLLGYGSHQRRQCTSDIGVPSPSLSRFSLTSQWCGAPGQLARTGDSDTNGSL